jgi:hypothetical protein
MMHGFDVYRTYLAMKLHFSNDKFDFFQYDGKVNAKETTYQDRNDFYFFETVARKYDETEIKEYMLASFVEAEDPTKVWIGDIKRAGRDCWLVWAKRQQSLAYIVEQDFDSVVKYMEEAQCSFNNLFETMGGHPPLLRLFYKQRLNIETLIVLDLILGYGTIWNDRLKDPLWEQLSFKIKKYKPFLSIPSKKYKAMLLDKLT